MSNKCGMFRINASVKDRDSDWPVWSSASVNLMRQRQVNLFRRPLRHECSVVATNTPGVADAPSVATTHRRFRNEVWFNENDTRITRQRVYPIVNGSVISNAQSEKRPGAELIERNSIEQLLPGDRRQVAERSQFPNDFTRDNPLAAIARVRDTRLPRVQEHADSKKQQS